MVRFLVGDSFNGHLEAFALKSDAIWFAGMIQKQDLSVEVTIYDRMARRGMALVMRADGSPLEYKKVS